MFLLKWPLSATSQRAVTGLLLTISLLLTSGCGTSPPRNLDNSCSIFREKDDWYEVMKDSERKWGIPVHVQLAIIYQESKFRSDAKPPRDTLLWVIPWFRKSSAYGYAQVKDQTWDWYIDKTGNWGADRDDFEDAVDFIGWYGDMTHRVVGVSKWDAYNQYLAYHEGHGGFKKGSYRKKRWLMDVARKVERRAASYRSQLKGCEGDLDDGWSLWPF